MTQSATFALDIPSVELSFDDVYRDNSAFVWRTLHRLGVSNGVVDDATQDVFIVVHRRLGDYDGRASMRAWLFGIARRVAGTYRRKSLRHRGSKQDLDHMESPAPSPHVQAETSQAAQFVAHVLADMPPKQRDVFVLAEFEQMTAPEIAQAVGANVNTVYSRMRLGRERFNAAVAKRGADL